MRFILIFAAIFGLSYAAPKVAHPRALMDDLNEFIALIPWTDINAINEVHLQSNSELIEIVLFLQSPDWDGIVDYVRTHPTWIELKAWIMGQGVNVDAIVAGIQAWIDSLVTGTGGGPETLRSYLDEVEAIIPWVDLLILLDDKMTNSADFQAFYVQISAETTHLFVEDVRALPELQSLAEYLTNLGVKVQEALLMVYAWLGWGAP